MTAASKASSSLFAHDPRGVFYATPELTQRINLIHHLIAHSEQLLLVLAEEGRGKTALLHQIAAVADEHWKVFVLDSTPALGVDALLGRLLLDFNVRPDGKPTTALRDALRTHIAATRYNGQLPVLIVDDAHMLPLETLALLVQLAMTDEPQTRMRVLLFCEPQITSIFAAPEFEILRNTLIHTLDIPPFSEKQVRGYLKFCLQQANFRGESPFTDLVVHTLYLDSEGVPGAVNKRARQLLGNQLGRLPDLGGLSGMSSSRMRRYWVIAGLGLLFALLIVGGVWLKDILFPSEPPAPPEMPIPPLEPPPEILPPSGNPQLSPETPPAALPAPEPPVPVAAPERPVPAVPATPPQTPPPAQPDSLDEEELNQLPGVRDEAWLRAQNPEYYTIQLLGAHDRQAVEKFVVAHAPQGELAMYRSVYKDKDWYVLVLGLYPDRSQATAAIGGLPAALRRATQPWVRSLGSIHTEMDRLR